MTSVHISQGFRHSPRHSRRSIHARVTEEKPNLVEIPESEPDSSSGLRKRKVKKRVLPEFYQSVQVTPTRKPVGTPHKCNHDKWLILFFACFPPQGHQCAFEPGKESVTCSRTQECLSAGCKPCSWRMVIYRSYVMKWVKKKIYILLLFCCYILSMCIH